ncbi:uncharacterized protein F5891DRAFT_985159 [Suillus fuscotomentosus]|uniref:Uncharacterized protein n=1 Tax=Suillus fuscotomentosus TaxID=1912939 RepID=A0AAD4DUX4_9AGAM|nr:uncharacterized protein F5891DRAFT_985159 [Suillus fuscotomentosus]KAG1894271.1 hypothetical protein F5891DRAFT_985159 [Suillus fuscotomentosus]
MESTNALINDDSLVPTFQPDAPGPLIVSGSAVDKCWVTLMALRREEELQETMRYLENTWQELTEVKRLLAIGISEEAGSATNRSRRDGTFEAGFGFDASTSLGISGSCHPWKYLSTCLRQTVQFLKRLVVQQTDQGSCHLWKYLQEDQLVQALNLLEDHMKMYKLGTRTAAAVFICLTLQPNCKHKDWGNRGFKPKEILRQLTTSVVISSVAELMDDPLVDTLDMVYEKFCWPAKKLSRGRVLEGMKFAYEEKETDSITWGLPLPSPSSSMMIEIHDAAFSPILVEHVQIGLVETVKAQERGTGGRGCLPVVDLGQ